MQRYDANEIEQAEQQVELHRDAEAQRAEELRPGLTQAIAWLEREVIDCQSEFQAAIASDSMAESNMALDAIRTYSEAVAFLKARASRAGVLP